jgi:hypothetical protein
MTQGVSEHEKVELKVMSTINFEFGTICDAIEDTLREPIDGEIIKSIERVATEEGHYLSPSALEKIRSTVNEFLRTKTHILQKETRKRGNNSIRTITFHLSRSVISKKVYRKNPPAKKGEV